MIDLFDIVLRNRGGADTHKRYNMYNSTIAHLLENNISEHKSIIIVTNDFDECSQFIFRSIYDNVMSANKLNFSMSTKWLVENSKEINVSIDGEGYAKALKISMIHTSEILNRYTFLGRRANCLIFDIDKTQMEKLDKQYIKTVLLPMVALKNDLYSTILIY